MKHFFILIGILLLLQAQGQTVFENSGNAVYPFLEEMAAAQYISINTFAKPFSRKLIAEKLDSLSKYKDELSKRQSEQLDFFLKDYGKELIVGKDWVRRRDVFYHSDSTFNITINPILAGNVMVNQNGSRIHRRVGAMFFANVGNFGFYGSLRDNAVSEVLALPQHLTVRNGENYKSITSDNRSDFNEAIGGISYQWKWGDVSLVKDRFIWGNTQRNAIVFSGKAPSYAAVYLRLYPAKWLDFQYMHGWLVSEELDSARTYLTPNGNRRVYLNKNIASNFITIKSNWKVDFTFGNSIVYSDNGVQPVYFIPFMFFKSADHTYSGTGSNELGQNAQMFFDISARAIKNLHLYASLFIDEISVSNITDADNHTNIFSAKLGAVWYNALPNLHLSAEYTRTNPWTYRHQIESTTYASNNYNLGHYLGENADEIFLSATYRPWRMLSAKGSIWTARKGNAHIYEIIQGNANVTGLDFMEEVDWEQLGISLDVEWEVINDVVLQCGFTYQSTEGNEVYTPEYFRGDVFTFQAGFRIGF